MGWIFDSSDFVQRSCCAVDGSMPDWIVVVQVAAHMIIMFAYLRIPFILWKIRERARHIAPWYVWLSLIAFIVACGLEHGAEAVVFYHPWYRLTTLMLALVALVSLTSAIIFEAAHVDFADLVSLMKPEMRTVIERSLARQECYSLALRNHPIPTALYNDRMCLIDCSDAWLEHFELGPRESLIGRNHYEIFPDIDSINPRWRSDHIRCLDGELLKSPSQGEKFRGVRLHWQLTPIEIDGKPGIQMVAYWRKLHEGKGNV